MERGSFYWLGWDARESLYLPFSYEWVYFVHRMETCFDGRKYGRKMIYRCRR